MPKILTKEQFENKVVGVHGINRYGYEKSDYKGSKIKVLIKWFI